MSKLSRERVSEEMTKAIVKGKSSADYFRLLTETGLIYEIAPEFNGMETTYHDNRGTHYGESVYQHTLDVLGRLPRFVSNNLVLTLAAMFHDVGKMSTINKVADKTQFLEHDDVGAQLTRIRLRALKFSNDIVQPVTSLVSMHMKLNQLSTISNPLPRKQLAKLFVFDLGAKGPMGYTEKLWPLMVLCGADQNTNLSLSHQTMLGLQTLPLVTGEDILNIEPRSIRGPLLRQLYYLQLSQGLDREELLTKRLNSELHNIRAAM